MLRIALIGCKNAAVDYAKAPFRLEEATFAAVVDADEALAQSTAEELAAPIRAATFDELLRQHADDFDAVVVRCNISSVESIMKQVATSGKHVLLQMPLLLGMSWNNDSIAVCQSAGATVMLSQPLRFLPSIVEVKSALESGSLGNPGLLRIHDWRPPNADEEAPAPPDEKVIGGESVFQDLLPDVDLANWVFGSAPSEIYASTVEPEYIGIERETAGPGYVQIHLGYADGGMALIDRCVMLPPGSDYFSAVGVRLRRRGIRRRSSQHALALPGWPADRSAIGPGMLAPFGRTSRVCRCNRRGPPAGRYRRGRFFGGESRSGGLFGVAGGARHENGWE